MRLLRFADEHPVGVLLTSSAAIYVALLVWSELRASPLLMAQAQPAHREQIYAQFGSSSVALLAVALTVLAILIALPDRPAVEGLRRAPVWLRLQGMLLSTALLCIITLICAHLGDATDDAKAGKEWLELLAMTAGAMAIVAILIAGVAFSLFLRASNQPPDPAAGRGS